MRYSAGIVAGLLAVGLFARAGEAKFAGPPRIAKTRAGARIEFAVSSPTDVEVAVLIGKYGNFDSQYVPPDSQDGKPLIATPDIPLCWPTGAGFTEKAVYICDTYNRRVVRADLTWQAEEIHEVK